MKNTILFTLFLFLFTAQAQSQNFTYKKCNVDGLGIIKTNGEVSITDTLLRITMGGKTTDYPVEVILKKEELIQMKYRVNSTSDTQIRFTYQPNTVDNKVAKYTLYIEIKDGFTNKVSSIIYFLIPNSFE